MALIGSCFRLQEGSCKNLVPIDPHAFFLNGISSFQVLHVVWASHSMVVSRLSRFWPDNCLVREGRKEMQAPVV